MGNQNDASRQQEPHTGGNIPTVQEELGSSAATSLGVASISERQIETMLTETRAETSTAAGENITHPHMEELVVRP